MAGCSGDGGKARQILAIILRLSHKGNGCVQSPDPPWCVGFHLPSSVDHESLIRAVAEPITLTRIHEGDPGSYVPGGGLLASCHSDRSIQVYIHFSEVNAVLVRQDTAWVLQPSKFLSGIRTFEVNDAVNHRVRFDVTNEARLRRLCRMASRSVTLSWDTSCQRSKEETQIELSWQRNEPLPKYAPQVKCE